MSCYKSFREQPQMYKNGSCMCAAPAPCPPVRQCGVSAPRPCTLSAPAPVKPCCHPAPLHCSGDSCTGSGYFKLTDAYGS